MTGEIQIEVSMLTYAFALGIGLRLVYDGLQLLRKIFFRGRFRTVCMDILYQTAAAGAVYGLMYRYASGSLRGMILLTALAGLVFMTAIDRKIAKKLKKRVKNG